MPTLSISIGSISVCPNGVREYSTTGGTKVEGNAQAASAAVLADLAQRIDQGELEIPIARAYPLAAVREAYSELEQRHTQSKIVLVP